jgi:hypothetical protein
MAAETAPKTGEGLASWVPHPLAEQLRAQAEAERRSVSQLIRLAIEDRLRTERPKERAS